MPAAPPLLGSTGSTTFVLVVLLVVLGIAMLVAGVWLMRATRTDTPALGPLEVMGDRRFRRDEASRTAALTGARPDGAIGPAPMIDIEDASAVAAVAATTAAPALPSAEPATVTPDEAAAETGETDESADTTEAAADSGPDEPAEAAPQAH